MRSGHELCDGRVAYSDAKAANRNVWGFGWEIAHAAVSRRPPISLSITVARTHMYMHAANVWVWNLSLVQGLFSVAPRQTFMFRFATFASLYRREGLLLGTSLLVPNHPFTHATPSTVRGRAARAGWFRGAVRDAAAQPRTGRAPVKTLTLNPIEPITSLNGALLKPTEIRYMY